MVSPLLIPTSLPTFVKYFRLDYICGGNRPTLIFSPCRAAALPSRCPAIYITHHADILGHPANMLFLAVYHSPTHRNFYKIL